LMGGLNMQIEHHLFPVLPRGRLGLARQHVREFCRSVGLPYAEVSWARSLWIVLAHLDSVGTTASAGLSKRGKDPERARP
jgi:fatty acid desaturase